MRWSRGADLVLRALDTERARYVTELAVVTGLNPTTVLRRVQEMTAEGFAVSWWEAPEEASFGRRVGLRRDRARRRYYQLTAAGAVLRREWAGLAEADAARRRGRYRR